MSVKDEIERDLGSPILSALEQSGITERYLARKLKEELNARMTEAFKAKILKEIKSGRKGGRSKWKWSEGVIYSDPLIDWDTRQEARKDAHKLRGDYPAARIKAEHSGTLELQLTPGLKKKLDDIYKR